MKFNKTKTKSTFEYRGTELEIVQQYTYLGLNIYKSGSYTKTIKDLTIKAQRAYYKLKSTLSNTQVPCFICLVLYACDVWGGFNVTRKPKYDSFYKQLLENDNNPYEHFNIKVSKHSLQLPKRTSNGACWAELGRLPLRHFIMVSVLKFQARMI